VTDVQIILAYHTEVYKYCY